MKNQFSLLEKYNDILMLAFKAFDVMAIIFGAYLASYIHYNDASLDTAQLIALLLVVFTVLLLFPTFNIYRRWRSTFIHSELWSVTLAWITTALLLAPLIFFTETRVLFSYQWIAIWIVSTLALLILLRIIVRSALRLLRKKGYNTKYVAILGAGRLGQIVAEQINKNDWAGIEVIAFLDDDQTLHGVELDGIPVIGDCKKIIEIVGSGVKEIQGPGLNRLYVNGIS
ncbi:MAG: nucleoside-diphosphate sugar epimerase/dehydratase, partial [Arenicellales bacterium]